MNLTTKIFPIDGMTCGHCVQKVNESLKGVSGVINANANLEESQVVISLDSEKFNFEEAQNILHLKGFELFE
jgi:copper chaperone CopZ